MHLRYPHPNLLLQQPALKMIGLRFHHPLDPLPLALLLATLLLCTHHPFPHPKLYRRAEAGTPPNADPAAGVVAAGVVAAAVVELLVCRMLIPFSPVSLFKWKILDPMPLPSPYLKSSLLEVLLIPSSFCRSISALALCHHSYPVSFLTPTLQAVVVAARVLLSLPLLGLPPPPRPCPPKQTSLPLCGRHAEVVGAAAQLPPLPMEHLLSTLHLPQDLFEEAVAGVGNNFIHRQSVGTSMLCRCRIKFNFVACWHRHRVLVFKALF
jgi:hypothetical protein